uniref:Uncharacterized protein n=1 Tax=Arundo donax TaxID=35708 RepID=A0A0A8Y8M9_ARUDO
MIPNGQYHEHFPQSTSNLEPYILFNYTGEPNPIAKDHSMKQWPFVLREQTTHQLLLCCCPQINDAVYHTKLY